MRGFGVRKEDAPGTVARATNTLCGTCYNRQGSARPADDQDSPCVLVRVDLRPSTYRAFATHARDAGTTIGVLLSQLADKALKPAPRKHSRGIPAYVESRIRELNAAGWSDSGIARDLGASQPTISRYRRSLGLQPPVPRRGGRQKAAT
jgi:hypothetical protein